MTTRKYTPPTCTLEVTTKKPRSGRSKDEDSSEQFQFKLSFDDPRLPEEEYVTVEGDRTQLDQLSQTVISYVQDFLNNADWFNRLTQDRPKSPNVVHSDDEIYLKSDGLLYHDLFFGSLATQNSGPFVHLSALQLFDLVTALEECRDTVDEIRDRSFSFQFQPLMWFRTLLMMAISIGALTGMIELINFYRQPFGEVVSDSSEETEPAPIALPNITPPVLPPFPSPTPTPTPSPPPIAENLPNVDAAPLPVPPPLFPAASSPPPAQQPIPNVSQQEGMMIILPEPQPASPAAPPQTPAQPQNPPPQSANPAVAPAIPPASGPTTPPPIPYAPPVPQVPPVIQLPPLQDSPSSQVVTVLPVDENVNIAPGEEFDEPEQVEDELSEDSYLAQLDKRPETIAATRTEDTTLFNQIPQVNEVRTYFQENWYPPKNLKKALQYSVQLNADGTIASITPVGQAALSRLSQLELPKLGEPFVSATADGRRPSIRIVLEPSGRVKAFLESFNNAPPENSSS
ncbi:MAG: DUF4335 domain-containing protein [Cyanobacteriota bacterium]|nr:DUF4335 domain-containing protein [Cyanobacteriota bacterium]